MTNLCQVAAAKPAPSHAEVTRALRQCPGDPIAVARKIAEGLS